ncbi:MAG: hypothetical protein Q7S87_10000 [Agitococcus sp.]|nr:hypothetical protein [Agitococcus sp.]MDO9179336.1 hypothetical protein [Agitococcus sp.]
MSVLKIADFTNAPFGLLVARSPHYCLNRGAEQEQRGIVVERTFFQDAKGQAICWPRIHWEGSVSDALCHPINAVAFRPEQVLPEIEMAE